MPTKHRYLCSCTTRRVKQTGHHQSLFKLGKDNVIRLQHCFVATPPSLCPLPVLSCLQHQQSFCSPTCLSQLYCHPSLLFSGIFLFIQQLAVADAVGSDSVSRCPAQCHTIKAQPHTVQKLVLRRVLGDCGDAAANTRLGQLVPWL